MEEEVEEEEEDEEHSEPARPWEAACAAAAFVAPDPSLRLRLLLRREGMLPGAAFCRFQSEEPAFHTLN